MVRHSSSGASRLRNGAGGSFGSRLRRTLKAFSAEKKGRGEGRPHPAADSQVLQEPVAARGCGAPANRPPSVRSSHRRHEEHDAVASEIASMVTSRVWTLTTGSRRAHQPSRRWPVRSGRARGRGAPLTPVGPQFSYPAVRLVEGLAYRALVSSPAVVGEVSREPPCPSRKTPAFCSSDSWYSAICRSEPRSGPSPIQALYSGCRVFRTSRYRPSRLLFVKRRCARAPWQAP